MSAQHNGAVAIVGMACRVPGAGDYRRFWANLDRGVDSIGDVAQRWDAVRHLDAQRGEVDESCRWCGLLEDVDKFDAAFFNISPREAKSMDPQQRLLLEETWHCFEDSGVALAELQARRTGVYVGAMANDYVHLKLQSGVPVDEYAALGSYDCMLANRISFAFGLQGPSYSIGAACASSLVAVHQARVALLAGECDFALAGGVSLNLHPWKSRSFSQARMLSPRGRCRTFDRTADGYVPGDGVAAVLLARLEDAVRERLPIRGVLLASAAGHVGKARSITAPRCEAQRALLERVLTQAGVGADTVSYVECHGTGTSLGDPIEVQALCQAFGSTGAGVPWCWLGSVKSNIGHLEAAAGIAGLVKVLLMFQARRVPQTLHVSEINPILSLDGSPFRIARDGAPWTESSAGMPLRAGVSSFGFGGATCHALLESPQDPHPGQPEGVSSPFVLSARTPRQLRAILDRWRSFVQDGQFERISLWDAALTLCGRKSLDVRVGTMVRTKEELRAWLTTAEVPAGARPEICLRFDDAHAFWQARRGALLADSYVRRTLEAVRDQAVAAARFADAARAELEGSGGVDATAASVVGTIAYVRALLELGVAPARAFVGEGGVLAALAASGMTDWVGLARPWAATRQAFDVGPVSLARPRWPLQGSAGTPPVLPVQFDGAYLAALRDECGALDEHYGRVIERARGLFDAQFTFRRHALAWNEALRPWGIDLGQLLERVSAEGSVGRPGGPPAEAVGRRGTALAVLVALERLHATWGIRSPERGLPPATEEIVALVLDGVLDPEHVMSVLSGGDGELERLAQSLQSRAGLLNPGKPYALLGRLAGACPVSTLGAFAGAAGVPDGAASICVDLGAPQSEDEARAPFASDLQRLWQAGQTIDWARWRSAYSFQRVALPVTPFDGESYWLDVRGDRRSESEWDRWLDPEIDPILTDVSIRGHRITPSPLRIEVALAAVSSTLLTNELDFLDLCFPAPGVFKAPGTIRAQVDQAAGCFIVLRDDERIATGKFRRRTDAPRAHRPARPTGPEYARERIYSELHAWGYEYGPAMRLLDAFWSDEHACSARIRAGTTVGGMTTGLDPFVLDCAFQAVFYASQLWHRTFDDEVVYVPLSIGRLALFQSLRAGCNVHLPRSGFCVLPNRDLRVDFFATDDEGRVVLEVDEMHFRRVPRDFLDRDGERHGVPAQGPPGGVEARLDRELVRAEGRIQELEAGMDALQQYAACELFLRLCPRSDCIPCDAWRASIQVADAHAKLWYALLSMFARNGFIRSAGEPGTGIADPRTAHAVRSQRRAAADTRQELAPFRRLIDHVIDQYSAVLRGDVNPMEVLFPGGSVTLFEQVYKENALSDHYNALVASAVIELVASLGDDTGRKITLVEVGAGTGGTTRMLLEALRPWRDRIRYLFTDVSLGFVNYARKTFASEGTFLEFRLFDVEREPRAQSLPIGEVDIVVATNVLHATRSLPDVIRRVATLLRRGGALVLNEITQRQDYWTIITGLAGGWWRAEDGRRIAETPLATFATWRELLASTGFQAIIGTDTKRTKLYEQTVMVATWAGADPPSASDRDHVPSAARPEPETRSRPDVLPFLKQLFAEALHMRADELDPGAPFAEVYGVDSFVGLAITERLEKTFGALPKTLLFEYSTLSRLAAKLGAAAPGVAPPVVASTEPVGAGARGAGSASDGHEERTENRGSDAIEPSGADHDVAVIGIAGRFPRARELEEFWANLREGRLCTSEASLERWDVARLANGEFAAPVHSIPRWGGFVDGHDEFDPLFFNLSPLQAAAMDPQQRLLLQVAWTALEDAAYTRDSLPRDTGVFVGACTNTYDWIAAEQWARGGRRVPDSDLYDIANRVSYFLDVHGPSMAIDTACSSSLTAVHLAVRSLRAGECAMAMAGGVSLTLHPSRILQFTQKGMLSMTERCHPFGDGPNGFVDGEGAAVVLLKPYRLAIRDGDNIYGVIKGTAIGASGRTSGYTVPSPSAQARLIRSALQDARVAARSVGYVEAHGTGTRIGDPIELEGLSLAFRGETADAGFCALGSVKSNLGHLIAAAGVAGLVKVLFQLRRGVLVPSIGADPPNPHLELAGTPFVLQHEIRAWLRDHTHPAGAVHRAGVSSFGAGGANAHVVVEEHRPSEEPGPEQQESLILISAKTEERLREYAAQMNRFAVHCVGLTLGEREAMRARAKADVGVGLARALGQQPDGLVLSNEAVRRTASYMREKLGAAPELREGEALSIASLVGWAEGQCPERVRAMYAPAGLDMEGAALPELAYTTQVGREPFAERLAVRARSYEELHARLTQYLTGGVGLLGGVARGTASASGPLSEVLDGTEGRDFVASLLSGRKLDKLGLLWVSGASIDWRRLYGPRAPSRVSAPTYPFARERYGLEARVGAKEGSEEARSSALFVRVWKATCAPIRRAGRRMRVGVLLPRGASLPVVELGEGLAPHEVHTIPRTGEGTEAGRETARQLWLAHPDLDAIIDLADWDASNDGTMDGWHLGFLMGAAERATEQSFTFLHATRGMQPFRHPNPSLSGALAAGVVRMLGAEYRKVRWRTIDFEPADGLWLRGLRAELDGDSDDPAVCYRGGQRYREALDPAPSEPRGRSPLHTLDASKAYVLTGGFGGIGRELARRLVAWGAKTLVLTTRAPESAREPDPIEGEADAAARGRTAFLEVLRAQGARTLVRQVDLRRKEAVEAMFRDVAEQAGGIGGVIHCAGALADPAAFFRRSDDELRSVIEPKTIALRTVFESAAPYRPHFVFALSSIAAHAPAFAAGAIDYAAANYFAEHFAACCRARGEECQAIAWPAWRGVGMGRRFERPLADLGVESVTAEEACDLLAAAAGLPVASILAATVTRGRFSLESLTRIPPKTSGDSPPPTPFVDTPAGDQAQRSDAGSSLKDYVRTAVHRRLRLPLDRLSDGIAFSEFGVDSILVTELVQELESELGIALDPTVILRNPTIEALAGHLARAHGPAAVSPHGNPAAGLRRVGAASGATMPASKGGASRVEAIARPVRGVAEAVAIVGMGCHFPGAESPARFWTNLSAGVCSIQTVPPTRWDTASLYSPHARPGRSISKWGGFIEGIETFDPDYFGLRAEEAAHVDPLVRQFLEVSEECLADAGYSRQELEGASVGVFVGARAANYRERLHEYRKDTILGTGQNFIAAHLAQVHDWRGPHLVVDTACSSSLVSVHLACRSLLAGECELALAGGVEILLDEALFVLLSQGQALSPDGLCHTFDEKANGFVLGEGAGAVLLKRLGRAIHDGDRIYALIESSAVNNDGRTMGITTPNPAAQTAVVRGALGRGGIDPGTIRLIEAHGTGTMIGDPIELRALNDAFGGSGASTRTCAIGSVKTNIGHLLSAAGIAGVIKVALALHHREIPPTLHCETPNPRFTFDESVFYPAIRREAWEPRGEVRRAGVSSFGFGGTNAHAVLRGIDGPLDGASYQPSRQPMPSPVFHRRRFWVDPPEPPRAAVTSARRAGGSGLLQFHDVG